MKPSGWTVGNFWVLIAALSVIQSLHHSAVTAQGPPGMPVFMAARHVSGQTIAPVYEGWVPNPDGSFSLYFGYMNRNYEEELDIPIGPDNAMDSGPDRGQPTHFLPRRNKNVFKVDVPKDFGDKKLTWTLSIRGKTESVAGTLRPAYQIVVSRDRLDGNTPPVIQAPGDQTVTLPDAATLTVAVTDDGLPKRSKRKASPSKPGGEKSDKQKPAVEVPAAPRPDGLMVEWSKYRGPGSVTFVPDKQLVAAGKATTRATFSAPGVYVLQIVADDGSRANMYHCCWTNAQMKVTVNPPQGSTTNRERGER